MLLLQLMMIMIGTFASTVAVSLITSHIVVADDGGGGYVGVEGIAGAASGPIADRCHNVQLPDRCRRLVIVDRANAADNRGRNLRFSITFCSYDCTVLLLLLVVLLLLLLAVTLIITTTDTVLLLLMMIVLTFGILLLLTTKGLLR